MVLELPVPVPLILFESVCAAVGQLDRLVIETEVLVLLVLVASPVVALPPVVLPDTVASPLDDDW